MAKNCLVLVSLDSHDLRRLTYFFSENYNINCRIVYKQLIFVQVSEKRFLTKSFKPLVYCQHCAVQSG